MWVALERTRWGYEIRLIGDSPAAARYAGIDIKKKIIIVFCISGALAGLGGMSEVSGVVHRLQDHISPGYGFTAIIIAYLARFGPFRVIVASILFGALILAGREIQPQGIPAMIQGDHPVLADPRRRPDPLPDPLRAPAGDRLMDITNVLAAGVATGTVLLFAAIGEIFAERAGVLNLGVEGMMLFGRGRRVLDRRGDRQPVARRAGRRDARRRPAEHGPRRHDDLACVPTRSCPDWR